MKTDYSTEASRTAGLLGTAVAWREVLAVSIAVPVVGALLLPVIMDSGYFAFVATSMLLFGIICSGYNIILGWANLWLFSPSALALLGGVSSVIAMVDLNMPFVVALMIGGFTAALTGAIIAVGAAIIEKDFDFVIATISLEFIVFHLMVGWERVGHSGLFGNPPPQIGGFQITSQVDVYILLIAIVSVVVFVLALFDNSRLGKLTVAMGENEVLFESIGHNPTRYKFLALILGTFIIGIGGSLYAHVTGAMTPNQFGIDRTIFLLVIVVLGGVRTVYGSIVGAVLLVGLPEFARTMGLTETSQYITGVAIILVVLFMPNGIVGTLRRALNSNRSIQNIKNVVRNN